WDRRGDPELQDHEAGGVGHSGGIGRGSGPRRRAEALSRREKYFEYACLARGPCRCLWHTVHRKGSTPSRGESLRQQPGRNETLLLRCAQHRRETGRGHATLVRAARKDRMLSGKTRIEGTASKRHVLQSALV